MASDRTINPELDAFDKDERFVAKYTGRSVASVRRDRYMGRGPRFRKLNSLVRYSLRDIHDWLQRQPSGGQAA